MFQTRLIKIRTYSCIGTTFFTISFHCTSFNRVWVSKIHPFIGTTSSERTSPCSSGNFSARSVQHL